MTDTLFLIKALTRDGNLAFVPNLEESERLASLIPTLGTHEDQGATWWFGADQPDIPRVKRYATGHMVFYTLKGHRFLMTDPEGMVLHEAEWHVVDGAFKLKHARMQLDSGQWVGLKPRSKKFSTHINITSQPGWKQMSLDDLRKGASQAWAVPLSEIKYFYRDENFVATAEGEYDVNLFKDGLFILIDGTFEKTSFISHMFNVQWEQLDLIPVVELFQSTLPGSGGAVFEFVWGLFDDQSRSHTLKPLRYRGLPTYPSKEAFNIFKAFFDPKGFPEDRLFDVFMNPDRSNEIEWTPHAHPPLRYFDPDNKLCVTVQDGFLYKATVQNDPAGLPFINTARGGFGSCDRDMQVTRDKIILRDGGDFKTLPLKPEWNVTSVDETIPEHTQHPIGWRDLFENGVPETDPVKILYTVPFYPEGAEMIDEASSQPMAIDQIIEYMEATEDMEERLEKIDSVLVHTFDTVISGCIDCSRKRKYTVLYGDPEFAVKNAQQLWNFTASQNQLGNLGEVKFHREQDHVEQAYQYKYDMIYKWIPFMYHHERETCETILRSLSEALNPKGLLFLQGPRPLEGLFEYYRFTKLKADPVVDMPFYRQHLKMCPENHINPDMTIFFAERMIDPGQG